MLIYKKLPIAQQKINLFFRLIMNYFHIYIEISPAVCIESVI